VAFKMMGTYEFLGEADLARDLGTAFKALRREADGDFTRPLRDPRSLADLTERSPLARDLLAWALSEAFERLLRGDEPP